MNAVAVFDAARIRTLLPVDVDRLTVIEDRAYAHGWSRGIFADCLSSGYLCRGLVVGEQLRGYYIVSVGAAESHLLNLAVEPDYQRQGFGKMLLAHALACAASAEAQCMFLEVRPSNAPARRLYEREGFNELGRRCAYYPRSGQGECEDALVLCRRL